jgi:hypothetical protein
MINGPMRPQPFKSSIPIAVASIALIASALVPAAAQSTVSHVTQSVTATVTFKPRTSLQLSTNVLRFDVTGGALSATATLDFSAGARAGQGDTVELVVDPITSGSGVLSVVEGPAGTITGDVLPATATVVARWSGGGLRAGRLTFRLQGVSQRRCEIPLSLRLRIS